MAVLLCSYTDDFICDICFPYLCVKMLCAEVLRPSQLNGVMSSAVSLPNHTFTWQA